MHELLMTLAPVLILLPVVLGVVTATFQKSVGGFMTANESVNITDNIGVQANPPVLPAQPGVLSVHTTNTTGTLTMNNAAHGIITGQRIDIYWAGGQCYGAVAGTVAGTSVPIASVSGGSNLPAANTPVTVGIPVSAPFNATGNNISALIISVGVGQNGYVVFNNGSTDVYAAYMTGGFTAGWKLGDPGANPLAATVPTLVWFSHNNSTTTVNVTSMQAGAVTH